MTKQIIEWAKQKGLSIKLGDNAIFLTKRYQLSQDESKTISIVVKQKRDYYLVTVWEFEHKRLHYDWRTWKKILWRTSKVYQEEIVDYLEMVYKYLQEKKHL